MYLLWHENFVYKIHKTKTKQQQKENNPKMAVLIQKYAFGVYSCVFRPGE